MAIGNKKEAIDDLLDGIDIKDIKAFSFQLYI